MSKSSITITETKDGVSVKKKSNNLANRIKYDSSYERTREHNADFGRAGKAAALFTDAFRAMLPDHITRDVYPRLQSVFFRVLKGDAVNERGERQAIHGKLSLLERFDFNSTFSLNRTLLQDDSVTIDRATGTLKADIPSFMPRKLKRPPLATHFQLTIGGAAIDFENERVVNSFVSAEPTLISPTPIAAQSLTATVQANSAHPLFAVFGIQYFSMEHGRLAPFKNRTFEGIQVVSISVP